jgi:hypothetical protein
METVYLAGNLSAFSQNQRNRGAGKDPEGAYYKRHAPRGARGTVLRIAAAIGAVFFGSGPFETWLH